MTFLNLKSTFILRFVYDLSPVYTCDYSYRNRRFPIFVVAAFGSATIVAVFGDYSRRNRTCGQGFKRVAWSPYSRRQLSFLFYFTDRTRQRPVTAAASKVRKKPTATTTASKNSRDLTYNANNRRTSDTDSSSISSGISYRRWPFTLPHT